MRDWEKRIEPNWKKKDKMIPAIESETCTSIRHGPELVRCREEEDRRRDRRGPRNFGKETGAARTRDSEGEGGGGRDTALEDRRGSPACYYATVLPSMADSRKIHTWCTDSQRGYCCDLADARNNFIALGDCCHMTPMRDDVFK